MEKEVVIFNKDFKPNQEFLSLIHSKKYSWHLCCSSLKSMAILQTDEDVIRFIKNKSNPFKANELEYIYKAESLSDKKPGYAKVVTVDTSKNWQITYDQFNVPYIHYIDIKRNCIGYTQICK